MDARLSTEATPPALKRPKFGSPTAATGSADGAVSHLIDQPDKLHLLACFDALECGLYFGHRVRGREFVSFDSINDDPASQFFFDKQNLAQILALMPDCYVVSATDVQSRNGEWTESVRERDSISCGPDDG
jgi:hypothetical protein